MRILHLASSYPLSEGDPTAPFVRSIARAQVARGHHIRLLVPARRGAPRHTAEPGIAVSWLPYAPHPRLQIIGHAQSLRNDMHLDQAVAVALPLYLLALFIAGLWACLRWRPHVIQAHWVVPNAPIGALLARLFGLPLTINLHGSDIFMARRSRLIGRVAGWTLRQATVIIGSSPALCEGAIALGADSDRVHVIPYGADPDRFHPRPDGHTPRPVVLAVGRLVAKKGFDVLMTAVGPLLAALPEAELWIAGAGAQRDALEALRAALPPAQAARVRLLGAVPWEALPAVLREAALFVAPSVRDAAGNQDGLPNVILEAMASGLPVVASDLAGIPLAVRHGETGLLVAPGDPHALSDALLGLLRDPARREAMGQAARALVVSELTWDAVTAQAEQLLQAAWRIPTPNSTGAQSGKLFDSASRRAKADKIWRLLEPALERPPESLKLLDVGCSAGIITGRLAEAVGMVVGVDLDEAGLALTSEYGGDAHFALADSGTLPFPDHTFDLAVCAQVYEHVSDQPALAAELYRVLKPGALLFFSGPNRLAPIEDHYGLPLLSWFPRPLASLYLRLAGRGTHYEERPLLLPQLRHLWRRFEQQDMTVTLLKSPERYGVADEMRRLRWLSALPRPLLGALQLFFPNYNWILRKP